MLVMFSSIFEADTKIISRHDFVATLSLGGRFAVIDRLLIKNKVYSKLH